MSGGYIVFSIQDVTSAQSLGVMNIPDAERPRWFGARSNGAGDYSRHCC